jgi:endonuclease/exonuclease/phosphatase (EEP) superfamily protein YafD
VQLFCRLIRVLNWTYLAILFAWLIAYLSTGDSIAYLGLVNLAAVYLFFPLPLVLLAALLCRSRSLGAGFLIGAAAFIWLWGVQFLPRLTGVSAASPKLSVMTYNVLASHRFTQPVIAVIRAENPDVVFIQELNFTLADALQAELMDVYPYQIFQAANNATGIGVISKFPLQFTGDQLPHRWIGDPLLLTMEWNGQVVHLVDFHMHSTTGIRAPQVIQRDFRNRAEQAGLLVEYARGKGPVILGGDANSVPISDAYGIFIRELHDAWREAGFGFGHTFPGSTVPGSDRPKIGGWYVPRWLARIDYIFFSSHWTALEARMAEIDGVSDHRGVVAILALK